MAQRAVVGASRAPNLVVLLLSLGLAYGAQFCVVRRLPLADSLILYGLAAVCFLIALRPLAPVALPARTLATNSADGLRRWLAIGFFLVAAACSNIGLRWLGASLNTPEVWGIYLVSLMAIGMAAWLLDSGRQDPTAANTPPQVRSTTHLCLLLTILLVAFCVRVDRLDTVPFGLWFDEAENGLEALRLLGPGSEPAVYSVPTNLPTAFLYLVGGALKLWGQSTFALRLVSTAFGLLTVVVFYRLVKELFGSPWLALAGAFLMAVARWDVIWSRIGMHGVTTPFFTVLVAYLFWRALRRHQWLDFTLAGVALGAGLWFYSPFRLFPLVVAVLIVAWWFSQRGSLRPTVMPVLYGVLAVILTIAPLLLFAYRHPETFFARTKATSVFKDKTWEEGRQALMQNLQKHLLMFTHHGDPNGRHNLPGEPMLDVIVAPLAVLGAAYCLYRWRDPRYLALLAWFAVILQNGVFSLDFEAPQSLRAIGSMPAAYLFGLVALERAGTGLKLALRGRHTPVLGLGLVAWLLVAGYANCDTYFRRQAGDFASWNAFSTGETVFAKGVAQLDDDYDVYASPLFARHPSVRFLAPHRQNYRLFDPTSSLPLRSNKKAVALFLEPRHELSYHRLREYYPAAALHEVRLGSKSPAIAFIAVVERSMVEAIQGLDTQYYRGSPKAENLLGIEQSARVDVDWQNRTLPVLPLTVQWEGTLVVPVYGTYGIALQDSLFTQVYLDEKPLILDQPNGQVSLPLAQGNHNLRVITQVVTAQQQTRLLWRRPQGQWEPLPREFLYVAPVTSRGLLGEYYANPSQTDLPTLARVDPSLAMYFHETPLPRPYSVEWTGTLLVPKNATYVLGLEVISRAQLFLDDRLLLDASTPNKLVTASVPLTAGDHRIRVTYVDQDNYSHIYLYWGLEETKLEYIPSAALLPW